MPFSRWGFPVITLLAIGALAALPACGGAGGPTSASPEVGTELVVQRTLPTNHQNARPDLSDAGEEQDAGVITVSFSERLDPTTVLDPANPFDGLTSDVNILDSALRRVPGTPTITGPRGNVLEFRPAGGSLGNGQYTITVSRDVHSFDGTPLNEGLRDFRSSFTIGLDTYAPIVRSTFPVAGQKDVSRTSRIVLNFNESLNPATVNAGTVQVLDGGTSPAAPVAGTVSLENDGFTVVFTPSAQTPMPPSTTVVVRVSGGPSGITDLVGNPFAGTPPSSTFEFQFQTVVEPPLPNNPWTVSPNPVIPAPASAGVYVGTDSEVGVIDETPYLQNFANLTLWGTNNPVPNSFVELAVDGQKGRVGEIIVDPRFNPTDGHSYLYVTDRANRALHVIHSGTSRIVYSWRQLPDPTGLAYHPGGTTLYVTNHGANTLSALDIGRIVPGARFPTETMKHLADLDRRQDIEVGRGPRGVAHEPLGGNWLVVANSLDDSVSIVDSSNFKVTQTIAVGDEPYEVAMTWNYPNLGGFAFVTNRGSDSVSLLWRSTVSVPPIVNPSGQWKLQDTVTGFSAPEDVAFDILQGAWVANSGGSTITHVNLVVSGSGFTATILPQITTSVEVGDNPTGVTLEPWVPFQTNFRTGPAAVIAAVRGANRVVFVDRAQPSRPTFAIDVPKARAIATYIDE